MTRNRPRPAALAALLSLVVAAGCGSTPPSGTPSTASDSTPPVSSSGAPSTAPGASASATATASGRAPVSCADTPAAASYAPRLMGADDPNAPEFTKIEGAVEAIRGITADRPVPRYLLDPAAACAYIRHVLAQDQPAALVAATEKLDKQLGLLAPDASLERLQLSLLGSQVLGRYDPVAKQMFVVSTNGGIGPLEQITYAHEFDHALQDQAFNLKSFIGDTTAQSDRTLARMALVEGDATLLMSLWMQQNLTPAQLIGVAGSTDPASQSALNAAPPILRETLLWPYTAGLQLTLGAYTPSTSYGGVDALWHHPADTTEQVLHPDKFASHEPAVTVAFPADFARRLGSGWKVSLQDTLGELELNILFRTGDPSAGSDPAAGWGGDRVALVEGPGGAVCAVVDTVWDTSGAAGNALDELQKLVAKLKTGGKHAAALMPSQQRVVLISADSDAALGAIENVLGLAG